MQKEQNPPPLSSFGNVYIEAQSRLTKKLETEAELQSNLEENIREINIQLRNSQQRKGPNIRQFVFRALEMNGFNCDNPIFDISTEDGGNATVHFNDFQEGDIMIDLNPEHRQMYIVIIDNINKQELMSLALNFTEYEDRRRKEKVERFRDYEVYYEGQLIYNKGEYYSELLRLSQDRLELHMEQRDELELMKRSLDELFPDSKLKVPNMNHLTQPRDQYGSTLNIRESMSLEPRRPEFVTRTSQRDIERLSYTKPVEKLNPFGRPAEAFDVESNRPSSVLPVSWNVFVTYLLYVNLLLLLCALFVNWERASFLPLTMSIVYITWWYLKDDFETLIQPIVLVVGYALSLGFDLTWLIKFSSAYWSFDIYLNDSSLKGLDKFIVVMSYIIVVCEACALSISVILMIKGMEVGSSKKKQIDLKMLN